MSKLIEKVGATSDAGKTVLALFPLLYLVTAFWKPALFDHKSLINGDAILHGLALVDLQAHSLGHLGQLLWSDKIYGGHPLFAEGQGAFADPLNMFTAWIAAPVFGSIYAMNLFHFLAMMLAGIGVMGLCRSLGSSRAAASFASIAVVYSSIWISDAQNLTISGALAWVPWTFWAMDRWLKQPTVRSAILLGGAVASLVLAGYPQAFHGAIMYISAGLITIPCQTQARHEWIANWRKRLSTAAIAVLFCAGISAIQWLPLLELTALSHRSDGVSIFFNSPIATYFRGFLFTWQGLDASSDYFAGTGSLLVTVLASLALVIGQPARVKGHLISTIFVLQMGFERGSPLFRLLYDHHIIPGLRYFRTVHLYFDIAIIGMAVLAAFAIDGISRWITTESGRKRLAWAAPTNGIRVKLGLFAVMLWILVAVWMRPAEGRMVCLAVVVLAAVGSMLLILARRGSLVPFLMIALLMGECLNLRAHSFRFYETAYAGKPSSVTAIEAVDGWRNYKLFDDSIASAYAFTDSRSPALPDRMRRMMESISAMTNLMWDLGSFNAALALPMQRQTVAEKLMRDEIRGQTSNPAGARLIDLLAIRFISVDRVPVTAAFRSFWSDPALNAQIMENTAARSRFQLYANHVTVGSADEAIAALKSLQSPTLVIENPPNLHQVEPLDEGDALADVKSYASFNVLKATSTQYRVDITATHPVWFFIADANYPGWRVTLDGKPAPLFSAQMLGKAVGVPVGDHRLEIRFVSMTFRWGMAITLMSLVLIAPTFLVARRQHKYGSTV